jgi:hypothetical protein
MARLGKRKTTERSKTHPRRHFSCDQCRRTSGSGGRAAGAAGKTCRPRQCHGRHGLWLRPRTVCAARPPVNHVGKAAIAGGRGPARLEAALAASCNGLNAQLGAHRQIEFPLINALPGRVATRVGALLQRADLVAKLRRVERCSVGRMMMLDRPLMRPQILVRKADKRKLPAIYTDVEYVLAGGLMSLGPGHLEGYYGAARYVEKILRGSNPAELPIAGATQFTLSVRRSALARLGLTLPADITARVNEWVD